MSFIRWWALSAVAISVVPPVAWTQDRFHVRGSVVTSESKAPLVGAVVTSLRSKRSASTDRLGRFSLWVDRLPDTLVAGFIGRAPDSSIVTAATLESVRFELSPATRRVPDLNVTADALTDETTSLATWRLSLDEIRAVPPAVESDIYRSLSLVPAVSFSTPLSARPIVRGYDGGESSFRIDGHEVLNLYHIGRAFSAFPPSAAQQVSVSASPPPVSEGGTLAGIIDVTGRGGATDATDGGLDLSLVSASAWLGHGGESVSAFGAARLVHLTTINAVSSQRVPYDFQDFYANSVIAGRDGPRAKITAFASRDHLLDRDLGSGMDWSNLLLGARVRVMSKGSSAITASASATRFAEDVNDIPVRRSNLDLSNRFSRLSGGAELRVGSASSRLLFGTNVGLRKVRNDVLPQSGSDFIPTSVSVDRLELGAYGDWSHSWGETKVQVGARFDAAGPATVFQPRARLELPIGTGMSLSAGVGRTGRLYHLVSDAQLEPDLAFYDFWLSAGEGNVPIPKVDHLAVDLNGGGSAFGWRLSAYTSRATGMAEVYPANEPVPPGSDQFRYGKARTLGAEIQIGTQPNATRRGSFTMIYVLSWSQRDWGGGWVPWSQDRRHLARAIGGVRLSSKWSIFGAIEATSAMPLTPVEQVVLIHDPTSGDGETFSRPAYKFGEENSARGLGTARADMGVRFEFKGFGQSRASVGFSVINLGFGPVSPIGAASPHFEPGAFGEPDVVHVRYQRLFDMPAIPTVTFRMEF
jgi:hypothetical protein